MKEGEGKREREEGIEERAGTARGEEHSRERRALPGERGCTGGRKKHCPLSQARRDSFSLFGALSSPSFHLHLHFLFHFRFQFAFVTIKTLAILSFF